MLRCSETIRASEACLAARLVHFIAKSVKLHAVAAVKITTIADA